MDACSSASCARSVPLYFSQTQAAWTVEVQMVLLSSHFQGPPGALQNRSLPNSGQLPRATCADAGAPADARGAPSQFHQGSRPRRRSRPSKSPGNTAMSRPIAAQLVAAFGGVRVTTPPPSGAPADVRGTPSHSLSRGTRGRAWRPSLPPLTAEPHPLANVSSEVAWPTAGEQIVIVPGAGVL